MNLEILHIILDVALVSAICYAVLILLITIGLYNLPEKYTHSVANKRKVSVLVAARNEVENIEKFLQSIYNQYYPKELFELVIVDDKSDDSTYEKIKNFSDNHNDLNIKLLHGAGDGKKAAISQALHNAENELILATDADCVLRPRWIESFVSFFEEDADVCEKKMILGPVVLDSKGGFFEKIQSLEHISLIASTAGAAAVRMPIMCNGANMCYLRADALEAETTRTDMNIASGDDVFLMESFVKKYGGKSVCFLMNDDAVVETQCMHSLSDFFRQRRRWVSKTKNYTDFKIISTALIVLSFGLVLFFFALAGFFYPLFWIFFALFTTLKVLIDIPILHRMTTFLHRKKLLCWVLPTEIVYPFYVVFTAFSGLFSKVAWKKRGV